MAPGSYAGKGPKRLVKLFLKFASTQFMRQVQVFNQTLSNGHSAPTPLLPFLKTLEFNDVVIENDMSDGLRKRFGNAIAGINQSFGESANFKAHAGHTFQQRAAFPDANIFSALRVVQRVTRAFGVLHSVEHVENGKILSEFSLKKNNIFVSRMRKIPMNSGYHSREKPTKSMNHVTTGRSLNLKFWV